MLIKTVNNQRPFSYRRTWIAIGSNAVGFWGQPIDALKKVFRTLSELNVNVKAISDVYVTAPVGGGRQKDFLNVVAMVDAGVAPAALLRLLKRTERAAGRRQGRRWGPRPLDLDVLSSNATIGRKGRRRIRGQIILPHPEILLRAFVLIPLADVAPCWWHPVAQRTARQLRHQPRLRGQIRQVRRLHGTAALLLGGSGAGRVHVD